MRKAAGLDQKRRSKKRHKRKTSRAVHSPRNPPHPENVSPRKRSPAPPVGESQCRHHADRLSCPGSPRFRDLPRQDRLCRRKDRSPLAVYYTTVQEANQTELPTWRKEKRPGTVLFPGWSNLLVKFRAENHPFFGNTPRERTRKGEKKNRTRGGPRMRRDHFFLPHDEPCGREVQIKLISA